MDCAMLLTVVIKGFKAKSLPPTAGMPEGIYRDMAGA